MLLQNSGTYAICNLRGYVAGSEDRWNICVDVYFPGV
jgi:hypothetical protein